MLGGLLSLLSAITFAYANASVRRGVLSGTVLQAVGISLPIALPIFLLVMWPIGGFAALATFDARSWDLLIVAGVIHFAWGRYCNYRATKAIGANLVAPVQQYSLIITLALAVLWLGEPLTVLRIVGIALVVAGPALTLKKEKRAEEVPPETPNETTFTPAYAEGYLYAFLSAIGFGLSPILVNMAFPHKGIAIGVAGGFVSYLAATIAIGLTLVLPGRWKDFRGIDRTSARWFVLSGILTGISQMTRYMALAVAPVSVVSPIQRLSLVFRIYFGWIINPKHEVFGGRIVAATVMSLIGAVALSVSVGDVHQLVPLPDAVAAVLNWHWSIGVR
ncbi:MAG: EamA family transporter [Pseudolabrys sp.]